jgi:hypothetical protein
LKRSWKAIAPESLASGSHAAISAHRGTTHLAEVLLLFRSFLIDYAAAIRADTC